MNHISNESTRRKKPNGIHTDEIQRKKGIGAQPGSKGQLPASVLRHR